jgi:hypothetical protein
MSTKKSNRSVTAAAQCEPGPAVRSRRSGPRVALAAAIFCLSATALAQEKDDRLEGIQKQLDEQRQLIEAQQDLIDSLRSKQPESEPKLSWSGYGVVNYYAVDWETEPNRRDSVDVERLVIAPHYRFSDKLHLNAEIEFEHGGTGATMELDVFEEFGEFEQEIESGGEVNIEQLELVYFHSPALNWRFGHIIVPIGLTNVRHEPLSYFTVNRPEAETAVIPVVWHETGVGMFGVLGGFSYEVQVVNGLDSTGFSSANWVASGHQGRFEMENAEALAIAGRLDFQPMLGITAGLSFYVGDSNPNRPKPDLDDVDGTVTIVGGHLVIGRGPLTLRALYLRGYLENADRITAANRTLSNTLNVSRTPVASEAEALGIEVGYDVLSFFNVPEQRLDVFARYDDYDTMAATEGGVFDNPRYDRKTWTAGLNYRPLTQVVFKGQFSRRELGLATDNIENTFALGLGVEF